MKRKAATKREKRAGEVDYLYVHSEERDNDGHRVQAILALERIKNVSLSVRHTRIIVLVKVGTLEFAQRLNK